ncbi:MAG: hypothetical protein IJC02_08150 [Lachnospiraceae bacterium]|nr:hypothetical protein [Lachnospiraceae bacterium]MBQ6994038.1 hypothetical protein [Lachnospiraceae bacterium]
MMCVFCGNRVKCWDKITDEELEMEWVKCGYDDYVLDEAIELEDLLSESERRYEEKKAMEQGRNVC